MDRTSCPYPGQKASTCTPSDCLYGQAWHLACYLHTPTAGLPKLFFISMSLPPPGCRSRQVSAFTIMEVLISVLLIALLMGSIVTINVQSIGTLRASRQAAASSQVLQQRIETIRDRTWVEVASSDALATLLSTPAESESEFSDAQLTETMKVTLPDYSASGPVEGTRSFQLRRTHGAVSTDSTGDFSTEPMLFFEGTVIWHDGLSVRQRQLRTMVCRAGLTRSGIVGSVLGRPGSGASTP